MSTPAHRHPIDPFSQALGRIEGKLDGVEKRFDALERYMLWGFCFVGIVALANLGIIVNLTLNLSR